MRSLVARMLTATYVQTTNNAMLLFCILATSAYGLVLILSLNEWFRQVHMASIALNSNIVPKYQSSRGAALTLASQALLLYQDGCLHGETQFRTRHCKLVIAKKPAIVSLQAILITSRLHSAYISLTRHPQYRY